MTRFGVSSLSRTLNDFSTQYLLHRKTFQMCVRFCVLIELCFEVQCRVGDSKAAHLIFGIRLDVGDTVNFSQIASHGSGTATSRHVGDTERHENPIGSRISYGLRRRGRSCFDSSRRSSGDRSRFLRTSHHRRHGPSGHQHWYKIFHKHSPKQNMKHS